jgi:hypothetical protein
VAIGAAAYSTTLVIFALIYLADGAAFILGQYCGMFESVYGEVEWAVLIYCLLKSNSGAAAPFEIQYASIYKLLCSLFFLAMLDVVWIILS